MAEQKFLLVDGNKRRESEGEDFPFGLSHAYLEATSTLSTSSSVTNTVALSLVTPVVPAGNFRIDWSYLYTTSNTSTEIDVRIFIDGVEVWNHIQDSDDDENRQAASGFTVVPFTNAAHTIEIRFKKRTGGNVTMYDRRIAVQRWD